MQFFAATVSGSVVLQQKEINDGKWLKFDDALKLLTFDNEKRLLRDVMSQLYPDNL